MAIPSALAGDFMAGPGTGSLGGPPIQHNYKRAVCRAPPALFDVEVLPPTKFGSGFCYGMRIYPVMHSELPDDKSSRSSKSSGSMNTEYDIWRRWEDCLWFQEILESEYALMARQKRQRLAAGKGVKKNGMYIHSDQAASFESLPPGPEASSIAKDIHEIVPKLTKKGTFFKASQATIDQRGKEFTAMMEALWGQDVPTLVKELRETRLVRDFFGYWRRDKDHDRKIATQRPSSSDGTKPSRTSLYSRASLAPSSLSMYFSPSSVDLSQMPPSPSTASQTTVKSPRSAPKSQKPAHAPYDPTASSSASTSPTSPSPVTPTPTAMQFSISHRGSLTPQPHASFSDDETSSGHRSISSVRFTRSQSKHESKVALDEMPIVFMPDAQPWSETGINGQAHERHTALQALPEDQELEAGMSGLSMSGASSPPRAVPIRRARNNSCPDRTNRNCVVFSPTPEEGADADADGIAESPRHTILSSSRPSSMALSMFSEISGVSSWRSSVASEASIATISTSLPRESCLSFETDSSGSLYSQGSSHGHVLDHRASVATMNSLVSGFSVDAVLPRRAMSPPLNGGSVKRSKSTGSRRPTSALSGGPISADDVYEYEQSDEVLDGYFYDPTLQRTPSPDDSALHLSEHSRYQQPTKQVVPPERFPKPFQNRPPGQFHLPWSAPNSPNSRASVASTNPMSVFPDSAASVSSPTGPDTLTIKAMLDDSLIVLVRVTQTTPFLDVRERIQSKFAKHEGVQLPDSFVIGYVPASERARMAHGRGRVRSNSTPTPASEAAEPLRIVSSEEEWHTAVASASSKLAVRILRSRS
ncbi:uncharacterized protein C8Q71DRAFT_841304 [Rhodofomes roseus]|uniref:PX domain-containing protein n=1 Tax=Rhodofomes roseus TaxID=34475 RepID=A0ABQ8K448_9APHY|nr:uncharacterized protein C8Q71DRAFT_841304 [Rhodofomes roseus]KAH9831614.1 hypothetical protein C8Q71DRAFT_841304 [Rhodofomes roseus]